MKTANLAVKNLSRQTIATARAGQCRTAFDKFSALAYWMGVLEAEEIGADQRGAAFDSEQFRRYSHASDAFRARCTITSPRRRRRR